MFLVCVADDFRKYRKMRKNDHEFYFFIFFFKNIKYLSLAKGQVFGRVRDHLYFNSIKTAIRTRIFFKELIFVFLNQKIVK